MATKPLKKSRSNITQAPENLVGTRRERAKNGDLNPDAPLTEMQRKFVVGMVEHQMTQTAAARAAGFSNPGTSAHELMIHPKIQRAIAERRAEYAVASRVTKKRVIDGFLEAIDMAKTKADPLAMIAGWREVGKMCGFYEPTKATVEISVNGRIAVDRLNNMSDAELLKMISDESVVDGETRIIEDDS